MTNDASSDPKDAADSKSLAEDFEETEVKISKLDESNLQISSALTESPIAEESENISTQTNIEIELSSITEANEAIKSRIAEIYSELERKNRIVENLEPKIEFLTQADENFSEWHLDIKNSFASKLFTELSTIESRLDADELLVRDWIANDIEIDVNFVRKTRNWFVARYLISLLAIGLVTFLIYILNTINTDEYENLLSFIGINGKQAYFYFWFIYAAYLGSLIFSYSRKWSRHRRDLAIALAKSEAIIDALDYIEKARSRIDSLHPQIRQYLEILAASIHKPWKVPGEFLNIESAASDSAYFPEGLDVASPNLHINDTNFATLVDKAVITWTSRGSWRLAALEKLIKKIAESTGLPFDLGKVDRDARKNGLRKLLLKTHAESLAGLNEILYEIARDEIREMVPLVQKQILPGSNLMVSSIKFDPLEGLALGDDLVDQPRDEVKWDAFLEAISGPCAPWSQLVFSEHGILKDRHDNVNRSFILGIEKFRDTSNIHTTFVESSNKATRPVDLLLRVDLSDWCAAGEVSIFKGMEISDTEDNIENALEENSISTEGAAI